MLWGVDLDVRAGELVCLMGRNGVGKTTLLKTTMGLLPARGGRVGFDGADITTWSPDRRARAGIGYVPQGREIFPHLSVEENLRMALLGCGRSGSRLRCRAGGCSTPVSSRPHSSTSSSCSSVKDLTTDGGADPVTSRSLSFHLTSRCR